MISGNLSRYILICLLCLSVCIAGCYKNSSAPALIEQENLQNSLKISSDDNEKSLTANLNLALTELDSISISCDQNDWVTARTHYQNFQKATFTKPQPKLSHPDISMALLDAYDLYNLQLSRAITNEDWSEASFSANQLTNIINDLIMQMQMNNGLEAQRELRRMIFLNRDMYLFANRGNEDMFRLRINRLRHAWNDLRPVVFDHHGANVAQNLDNMMLELEKIESMEDYGKISKDLSIALTNVANIITEPPQ